MAKCAKCPKLKTCEASKGTWGCRFPEKEALPWKDLYPPATRIRAIADDIAGQLCAESVDTYSRSPAVTTFIAKILRQWEKDKIKVEAIRTLRDLKEADKARGTDWDKDDYPAPKELAYRRIQ